MVLAKGAPGTQAQAARCHDDQLSPRRRGTAVCTAEYRDGRSSYRRTFGPVYLEYSDLLLRWASPDPARAAPPIREARENIERLKGTELQDYFRDTCVTSFLEKQRSIESMAPGTAVIYPIALPDRLELLVGFGDELRRFTAPIPEATLRDEVRHVRELLEKRAPHQYLVPAWQLYDQIIRPIDPVLAAHHIDTLVIVPDYTLRTVPFAALHDGKGFLVDRYAIARLACISPTREPLNVASTTALVLGVSKSVEGYVPLRNVDREVAAMHDIESGEALLNNSFSRARFKAELKHVP